MISLVPGEVACLPWHCAIDGVEVMYTQDDLSAREAIGQLFDAYADDVYRFSLSLVGDQEEAKDVVQEVFFRAYQSWREFRGDSTAKTWLFRIARNYIVDVYRKSRSVRLYVARVKRDSTEASNNAFERSAEIRDAISRLKPNQQMVITLRFLYDLSIEDTASVLGWTSGRVRTVQRRALTRLKLLMSEHVQPISPAGR